MTTTMTEMWPETLDAVETALHSLDAADVHRARNLLRAARASTAPQPVETLPRTFIAIAPFAWGKGDTVSAAVKKCKPNIPSVYASGKQTIKLYRVVGFEYVNGLGGIVHANGGSVELVDEQTVTVRK